MFFCALSAIIPHRCRQRKTPYAHIPPHGRNLSVCRFMRRAVDLLRYRAVAAQCFLSLTPLKTLKSLKTRKSVGFCRQKRSAGK